MTAPVPTPSSVARLPHRLAADPLAAAPPVPAQRRFRAADVALHLDMGVIGDVCVAISLSGYRSIVGGFLDDSSGNQALLLAALDGGRPGSLSALAHPVLGAAASLGLRAVARLAKRIEDAGVYLSPADCAQHAAELRAALATARALLQRMGFE